VDALSVARMRPACGSILRSRIPRPIAVDEVTYGRRYLKRQ